MKTHEILSLAVPALFLAFLALESILSHRPFQPVPRWRLLGILFFVMTMIVGAVTPLLLPVTWLKDHALFDLSVLGVWEGVIVGVLTVTFSSYWLHRAEHRFNWLWRATHQLHHSPQRIDMWGAFYSHPFEVIMKVALGVLVTTFVLGVAPMTAAIVGLITASLSMFQHWNVKTPRMLGYLIPRPESHCLHHEREVHGRNYRDLPIWDILFLTYENPHAFHGEVGFNDQASTRIGAMLMLRDVHQS